MPNLSDTLIKLFGWKVTSHFGDPGMYSRARWIKKHILPGPIRTLDAGCGTGALTFIAAAKGNVALGLSDNERCNRVAEQRAKLTNLPARFQTVDLRELHRTNGSLGSFDQVLLIECIEHVLNDQKLVDDLAKLLKPGGRFILTTPYKFHHPYFEEWKMQTGGIENGGHVRFGYTHDEIETLFNNAGLEVESKEYLVGFISIQLANIYLILGKLHPLVGWIATLPFRLLQPFDDSLTRTLRYPFLSVGVVGTKKLIT